MTSFGPFYCIWAYWSLIQSLTQFDEILRNFPNLIMFRILSIIFAKDLKLTWSLCLFADNSKIYKLCERIQDQIRTVKWTKSALKLVYGIWRALWAEIFNWGQLNHFTSKWVGIKTVRFWFIRATYMWAWANLGQKKFSIL